MNSLHKRFIASLMVSAVAMALLFYNQIVHEKDIQTLQNVRVQLSDLSVDLLQMRRFEKDFLIRNETSYLGKFIASHDIFNHKLEALIILAAGYPEVVQRFADVRTSMDRYVENFYAVIQLRQQIEGEKFLIDKANLESSLVDLRNVLVRYIEPDAPPHLLEMIQLESSFVSDPSPELLLERNAKVAALRQYFATILSEPDQSNAQDLLNKHDAVFQSLADKFKTIGLHHEEGLRAEFRLSAMEVEELLSQLQSEARPFLDQRIAHTRNKVTWLILTSALLLIGLASDSMFKLRRSITHLSDFFDNAHRENVQVDVANIQFKELRHIAERANQMVNERQQAQTRLEQANTQLAALAMIDEVTQIANRRSLNNTLEREWNRAVRQDVALSVMLIDIDHFKWFNDNYGHQAGDAALRKVASVIAGCLHRDTDICGRYGGEEFAVVLPDTDIKGARKVAARIVKAVEKSAIIHTFSSVSEFVTVSAGVTTMLPCRNSDWSSAYTAADQALYQAKTQGRNQFCEMCLSAGSGKLIALPASKLP